jgi:hypothetical protein
LTHALLYKHSTTQQANKQTNKIGPIDIGTVDIVPVVVHKRIVVELEVVVVVGTQIP